jgi:pilus assembly protein CpaF
MIQGGSLAIPPPESHIRSSAAPGGAGKANGHGPAAAGSRTPARSADLDYRGLKSFLERRLLDQINLRDIALLPDDAVKAELAETIGNIIDDEHIPLSGEDRARVVTEVRDEVFGLGPLEPLLEDSAVSDILVNSAHSVYVEKRGVLELTPVRFTDNAHLLRVIEKIVSRVGRRVDEGSPLVDARLPDGSRVNAVIPPITIDGPALSIRRFGRNPLKPEDLVEKLAFPEPVLQFLQGCVKARLNIVISGGTGSGKTTLLNALSSYISNTERIVTIEDAAELRLQQPHVVRTETRPTNIDGQACVSIRHLVVNALRMRPDRIVVGEVRSEEALDMLQAMNTGHDGSLTTIHANNPRDALARLETMVTMANSNLGIKAIRQQIASAIHIIVQASRLSDGSRRVTYVTECTGMEGEIITLQDVFVFEQQGVLPDGKVSGRFRATGIRPKVYEKIKTAGVDLPLSILQTSVGVNLPMRDQEMAPAPTASSRRW